MKGELEYAAKLLPPYALIACKLFPSFDVSVKGFHVPLAEIFEAQEGIFWSSFARGQLPV